MKIFITFIILNYVYSLHVVISKDNSEWIDRKSYQTLDHSNLSSIQQQHSVDTRKFTEYCYHDNVELYYSANLYRGLEIRYVDIIHIRL